jgi:hypothetical protein
VGDECVRDSLAVVHCPPHVVIEGYSRFAGDRIDLDVDTVAAAQ